MQDLTRSFAGESKDTEKFDLYMAATHFAETIENLVTAQELVDEMEGILHKQLSVFEVHHLITRIAHLVCIAWLQPLAICLLPRHAVSACQFGVPSLVLTSQKVQLVQHDCCSLGKTRALHTWYTVNHLCCTCRLGGET